MDKIAFKYTFPILKAENRDDGIYLVGFASGPEIDRDEERIAPEAIVRFAQQIEDRVASGDPLPYRDAHAPDGVLRDLGVLTKAWVNEHFHLGVEVRLDAENPASKYLFEQVKRGKQYGMSVSGSVLDWADEFVEGLGKAVRTFKHVILDEISNTTRPAWYPSFGTVLAKSVSDVEKAVWSAAYVNDLPDSSFAYISPGGEKDSDGKTTPRSLRHLPYKDANGKPDAGHVRNALARLSQTDIQTQAKSQARTKLLAAAKELGIEVQQKSMDDEELDLANAEVIDETGESDEEQSTESVEAEASEVGTDDESDGTEDVDKAGRSISAANRARLLALHNEMTETLIGLGVIESDAVEQEPEKSAQSDETADTLKKAIDEAVAAATGDVLATNEALTTQLGEATARIAALENAPRTQLPGAVVDGATKSVEDQFKEEFDKASPQEKLRMALAAQHGDGVSE